MIKIEQLESIDDCIRVSEKLVKPETFEEWKKRISKHFSSPYPLLDKRVVQYTIVVLEALSKGKDPKSAEKMLDPYLLSGTQVGIVKGHVIEMHPRGQEFDAYLKNEVRILAEEARRQLLRYGINR